MINLTHGVSPVLEKSSELQQYSNGPRSLRIDIVSPMGSARFDHRSRVEMVGSHTIDDEPSLLGQVIQFLGVELNHQNVYTSIST